MQPGWSSPFGLWKVSSGHGRVLIIKYRVDTGVTGQCPDFTSKHVACAGNSLPCPLSSVQPTIDDDQSAMSRVDPPVDTGHWGLGMRELQLCDCKAHQPFHWMLPRAPDCATNFVHTLHNEYKHELNIWYTQTHRYKHRHKHFVCARTLPREPDSDTNQVHDEHKQMLNIHAHKCTQMHCTHMHTACL